MPGILFLNYRVAIRSIRQRCFTSTKRRRVSSRDFFIQLERHLIEGEESRIFLVLSKGKIIGGSACIYSDETAYLWFSSGLRKTYALLYPGALAIWATLKDARERGYKRLEYMDV